MEEALVKTVLAIDPGPVQSAYVLWDGERVEKFGIVPNREIFQLLESDKDYVSDSGARHLAIEMIACYGMAVGAEVFQTCLWIGRFLDRWRSEWNTHLVPRLDVKMHLCHSARAKDANVRQALIDRFGAVGTKRAPGRLYGVSSHCWAALGVAVTTWDRL